MIASTRRLPTSTARDLDEPEWSAGDGLVCGAARLWLSEESGLLASNADAIAPHFERDWMTSADRARWIRYRLADKRRQFAHGRRLLRYVLECESRRRGMTLGWRSSPAGRPECVDESGREVVSISLSHSGPVAAVAVTELPLRVGVDIEIVRPIRTAAVAAVLEFEAGLPRDATNPDAGPAGDARVCALWVAAESAWKANPQSLKRWRDWSRDLISWPNASEEADRSTCTAGILQSVPIVAGCEPLTDTTIHVDGELAGSVLRGCVSVFRPELF